MRMRMKMIDGCPDPASPGQDHAEDEDEDEDEDQAEDDR
jgi:hypothetical protein